MNQHRRLVVRRALLIVGANIVGFALCQGLFRAFETWASKGIVDLVVGHGHTFHATPTSIGVLPNNGTPFVAIITPSCSALASVLALLCLSTTTTRVRPGRRIRATTIAVAIITLGNIVRISASTGVGVLAGRSSLVLFHDWVGGLLTFAYTLGGYVLMLYLLLPDRRKEAALRGEINAPPLTADAATYKEMSPGAH